jgi:endonuclease/exonuclease/phosphatase family metal-dependent hydrolase
LETSSFRTTSAENVVLQGFSLKNHRTCETTNRVVEQIHYSMKDATKNHEWFGASVPPLRKENMSYTIGSFNTRQFSGVGTHDIGIMADIILSERFDIVALQEVKRQEALELLKKRLPGWDGRHGRPGYDSAGDLGFGYLWNTKRVRECSKDGQPIIFQQYRSNIRMKRNPFYARFTPSGLPGGAFFEIRLIDVHLFYSDPAQRVEEYKLVTGDIHNYISTHRYGDNMPAYTIILGDYNLYCAYCGIITQQTGKGAKIGTKQEEKTTISSSSDKFVNDYDHFSYDEDRFVGTTAIIERVNSVFKYCKNNFEKHKEKISDHVPIKLELVLN